MRILHLIDHMGLGGAQNLILDLVETRSSKIDVAVWTLSEQVLSSAAKRLESADVPIRTLGLSKFNPLGLLRLRTFLRKENPDLLHTHLQFSSIFGIAAALSLGKHCPRLVNHVHNDPLLHYTPWQRAGIRLLAPFIDVQITSSSSLRKKVMHFLGNRARRIEAVTPGINLKRFEQGNMEPKHMDHFRGGAALVVGTAARLTRQKALHVLLEATPALLAAEPSTRVLIAGDGPLRHSLERQAARLKISHAVAFLGYQSDMAPVYRAMDVLVLPSEHEGFGIALIEAMALKIPVVATRVVGIVDAVEDGVTGLLVPYGDAGALSSAILRVWERTQLKRELIHNASLFVLCKCSREFMTARIESVYFGLGKRKN